MHAVNDDIETIHLYVVREEPKKPYTLLPLLCALLCLVCIAVVTLYSEQHPYYEHERVIVPAHFFTRTFSTTSQIVPTGKKTYPATTAQGILTITNGSIIAQTIPQGFIVAGVATDNAVFVPAGSASGFGYVTVTAHALQVGKNGNILPSTINVVEGSSIYIRNLQPFTGGRDAYTVTFATPQDKQTALANARAILTTQEAQIRAMLTKPCNAASQIQHLVLGLVLTCQFASYPSLPGMKITRVRLVGKNLFVDVVFVARSHGMIVPK